MSRVSLPRPTVAITESLFKVVAAADREMAGPEMTVTGHRRSRGRPGRVAEEAREMAGLVALEMAGHLPGSSLRMQTGMMASQV
jgi:hypothetical protein